MTYGLITELNELIALRRLVNRKRAPINGRAARAGSHLSRIRGRGMDFAEVRNYQAGDEIRHMEWRVTARTGRPHIKVYQEERERPVILLVDFNPSMFFGTRHAFKSVVAARLAALIAWAAINQEDRIGALLFSPKEHSEFMPKSRQAGALPILAALSSYTQQFQQLQLEDTAVPLNHILMKLNHVTRPGSVIVLISDFYELNEECEKYLSRLKMNNDVLAYHVCDALELSPPKPALYAITNGRQELLLDTTCSTLDKNYKDWCNHQQLKIQTCLKRLQIQYSQVTAEMDLSQLVNQTFPRRRRG
ncbi:Uncharacterized conserved protein (some members contain a von Willebrand factor type A (vWA) domain) [Legionella beliardensis]|uniref:Uncharacterized conserved protein (Some members contain a von Willebrand factor type A (VWA) domain) n=1 Tax=Legionella beliardensis TaxID=91822 RepID=A0A378I607_9GAMM|nr:DUF58 domain-containing protein [Legionella beliardensis]STX30166.1 Uncharacterized conserved protein (some members contain a von Willebrand factor type A (vWA) domain) [Legionella beliardensis]